MAGYICKIVIEDTHPPVWRRVLIPDKITFYDLHQIIQTVFQWEEAHLHAFRIPSDDVVIDDEGYFDPWGSHYHEMETCIDEFFENYKWIRYTYDFGDDWRHRINIEKYDKDYKNRQAKLLKYKGDNFQEDSGGIWGWAGENNRFPFDQGFVEEQLESMNFPEFDQKNKMLQENDFMNEMEDLWSAWPDMSQEDLEEKFAQVLKEIAGDASSKLNKKIEEWMEITKENDEIKVTTPIHTQKELLKNLSEKQSSEYCKYLGIEEGSKLSHDERINAICKTLKEHPEYILYIFEENEYNELEKWMDYQKKYDINISESKYMFVKVLSLGLGDFEIQDGEIKVYLTEDFNDYIDKLNNKIVKKTYENLDAFDDRIGKLVQMYCVIELGELYRIYKKIYRKRQSKEEFSRFIYWHAGINDYLDTFYTQEGIAYVAMKGMDIYNVLEKRDIYAKDLPFVEFSDWEIDELTDNLANRCDTMDIFFSMLCNRLGMPELEAMEYMLQIISDIMNGAMLSDMIKKIKDDANVKFDSYLYAEMWSLLSDIMMELELPMLKARTRIQYAEEQKISPWTIGMLPDNISFKNTKNQHLYEFPREIQEQMYNAETYGDKKEIDKLFAYKKEEQICSEEYMYMLSSICVTGGYIDKAKPLIKELKRSSTQGKKLAQILEEGINQYDIFMNDFEENMFDLASEWDNVERIETYRKTEPKIGRNDPCPCGSGKKYKKCCGKNK